MRTRGLISALLVMLVTTACAQSRGGGGGTAHAPGSVEGHIDKIWNLDVKVNGTSEHEGFELTTGSKVTSTQTGDFEFSLTEKVRACRTEPESSLTIRPSAVELVHWDEGSSWCLTMPGKPGDEGKTFTAGQGVTLTMQDPLFGVTVIRGQRVVVKVVAGLVEVSSKADGKPVLVGPAQQVVVPAGKGPEAPTAFTPDSHERAIIMQLQAASPSHLLTVANQGSGSVTSNPSGISCGQTCRASFAGGSTVILTATAGGGSVFAGWQGDCSGTASCTLTMSTDRAITALFNPTQPAPKPATTIDDFVTGSFAATIYSGQKEGFQQGPSTSIMGGSRFARFIVGQNPQNQPCHIDIGAGALNVTQGGAYTRLEVLYGKKDGGNGTPVPAPLHVNLVALGDRFRIPFRQTDNRNINFNILVYSNNFTKYSQGGKNLGATKPFVAEFPFDQFTFDQSTGGANFNNVDAILFIFQTSADFTVDSFQIV